MAGSQLACLVCALIIAVNSESYPMLGNFGHLGKYVGNLHGHTDVGTYLGGMQEHSDGDQYHDGLHGETDASGLHDETEAGGLHGYTDVGKDMGALHEEADPGKYLGELHGQTDIGKYLSDMRGQTNAGLHQGGLHGHTDVGKYITALRGQTDAGKYLSGLHGHDVGKQISALRGQTNAGTYLGGGGLHGHANVGKFIGILHGATPLGKYLSSSHTTIEMPIQASAILSGEHVNGKLTFFQTTSTSPVVISGEVHGLHPGKHGMHVHVYGDMSQGCESNGPHFNPYNKNHGGKKDTERHLGDLGNIKADAHGIAKVFIIDQLISLKGPHSIVGRSMVVHENPDDLGKGADAESKESGNSGGRLACGVIILHH